MDVEPTPGRAQRATGTGADRTIGIAGLGGGAIAVAHPNASTSLQYPIQRSGDTRTDGLANKFTVQLVADH